MRTSIRILLENLLWTFALCVAAIAAGTIARAADEIVVVVNPKVGAETMTADQVRAIFLGEKEYWNGTRVYPVTFPEGSRVMQEFLRLGLGMTINEYRSWWIKRIFRRADVPPQSVSTPEEAVEVIRAHAGGIGFLSAGDMAEADGLRPVLRLGP